MGGIELGVGVLLVLSSTIPVISVFSLIIILGNKTIHNAEKVVITIALFLPAVIAEWALFVMLGFLE